MLTDLPIRLARSAFNKALAEGDLAAIGPMLAPDCVLVAGTDSAVLIGCKAQVQAWKHEFAARPRTVYVRTPETIVMSPVMPIAMETGQWEGACEGATIASGTYSAKWREVSGAWVIEAEIYVTLG
jgi:ketosteroid isomerase-like protein